MMFENLRRPGWFGIALVLGAAAVAPQLFPAVGRAARPAAKSALKAGLTAFELARERLDEVVEAGDDLLAEVRSELEAERRKRETDETAARATDDDPSDAA